MRLLFCALVAAAAAFFVPVAQADPPPFVGTVLNIEGQRWTCDRDLSLYSPGGPPLTVNQSWTREQSSSAGSNGSVRLQPGCTALSWGGQDGIADLILNIEGDGNELGSHGDGMNLNGVHDLDIGGDPALGQPPGGSVDCAGGGAHKDGIQVTGGSGAIVDVWFWGFRSGDWMALQQTCHGAGGIGYWSPLGDDPNLARNIRCVACIFVASGPPSQGGAALHIGGSQDSGAEKSCLAGNFPIRVQSAVRPVDEQNFTIDLNAGTPQPDKADCPALTAYEDAPPDEDCDEECEEAYKAEIATLTEALVLRTAERDIAEEELGFCRRKLSEANAYYHGRVADGRLEWAFKMHAVGHRRYGCVGIGG